MEKVKVAVIYCSKYGHTKLLAEAVVRGVNLTEGCDAVIFTATEAGTKLNELDKFDGIIFGSPTYMGSIASEMKAFFEKSVSRWFSRGWKDKVVGGFTNSSNFSGDKLSTLESILIYAMQMGMIWVGVAEIAGVNEPEAENSLVGPTANAINRNGGSIGPMASSFAVSTPQAPSEGDIKTAEAYGARIASITRRFTLGAKK